MPKELSRRDNCSRNLHHRHHRRHLGRLNRPYISLLVIILLWLRAFSVQNATTSQSTTDAHQRKDDDESNQESAAVVVFHTCHIPEVEDKIISIIKELIIIKVICIRSIVVVCVICVRSIVIVCVIRQCAIVVVGGIVGVGIIRKRRGGIDGWS